ncbi:MAG: hypothetical protein B7Z60_03735 [Ferrovum sp. 37-45-19]|uniref:complex I NDUFA9 subunit family protein n=1 Tax=Ferrovum sp. JA12 TaxID=1356299 RepID=UPI000716074D|nr:complex I NDUFA9 subunit family protein [Ferrovum sp. JA12]OYV78922.1 MAG: hypothetical protein B7Z65_08380 [Ferrovum sp. 21-44-67]OYV94913.1 MAG: hypothetical protein B7Z60_03735 [Ferrovum sp. 37-45-19]HQT82296.1 complex I NDUFA9 subunit family protein [Ferrovaceae bacterium]KRH79327.1 hypothetical protein FERRO_03910 [Ferrovum sp. JA12]HQU06824.1 complex I NDUFA9 subunit family protein [Ferrovaceae bacterium]
MTPTATVILIGGSGFVGRHLTDILLRNNYQVVIVSRHHEATHHAKEASWFLNSNYNLDELTQLFSASGPSSFVINLVGQLHDKRGEPFGPGFNEAHVELPTRLVAAMKSSSLTRLIHVSSIGAGPNAPSMYQRSKGVGEKVIKESLLNWTIVRPSVIFGRDDQFIQLFASLCRVFPVIPLASSTSRFQPVYVGDVALAISQALQLESTCYQVIELAGPSVYSLKELVEVAGRTINKKPLVIPLPHTLGYLQALVFEHLPGKTLMSRDNLASMSEDNILQNQAIQPLKYFFNINPTPLETLLP